MGDGKREDSILGGRTEGKYGTRNDKSDIKKDNTAQPMGLDPNA